MGIGSAGSWQFRYAIAVFSLILLEGVSAAGTWVILTLLLVTFATSFFKPYEDNTVTGAELIQFGIRRFVSL